MKRTEKVMMFLTLFLVMVPSVCLAQDEPEMAGAGWDIFASVLGTIGAVLMTALSWATTRLAAWLNTKYKNAVWVGMTTRVNQAMVDAVGGRLETMKASFAKARAADSPGGARITKEELEVIKDEVWEDLKAQYGGFEGVKKLLGVLAGDDVERWVKNNVAKAVAEVERADTRAASNPK